MSTTNFIGVVIGNPGTSGNAVVVESGPTPCLFDSTTPTANDYVVASTTSGMGGRCSDAGSTYPTMQLPLGVVVSTGSASAVGSIFLYPKLTSPGALYLNTAIASSGVSGSIVVDTGAGGGTGTAGQIQIGPTNTSGVAIGGASGTLGLVGIGGANTSTNPDILQVKAVPTGHSGIELAYTNSALGYGSVDFFDTTTPAYEWAIGAAPSSYSDTKLTGPKFFIRKGPVGAPTYPLVVDTSGHVGIGPQAPSAFLDVSGPVSTAPSATVGVYQNFAASTLTDNATAGSGTAPGATFNAIQIPTLAATNASVTTTNAYTLQILGAPLAGTNETLTNSTAFNIATNALVRTTNGFGLQVHAPSGATNNYAATFLGGGLGIGTSAPLAPLDTRQATNGQGTIHARRATDTAPAGNFVQFQNNAGSVTAFSVDVNGNMAVNGSASLQGGLILKRATTTGSVTYSLSASDYLVAFTAIPVGGASVQLPNASAVTTGQVFIIKDEVGGAGTNNITISPAMGSGQLIDGAGSLAIVSNYGFRLIYSDGSNWHQW